MTALETDVPLCFRVSETGSFVLCLRADHEDALKELLTPVETLWRRLALATPVARGRSAVALWRIPGRDERVVLRRYTHGGLLGGALGERLWGIMRPLRELAAAEWARESGVATPLPLGVVIQRLTWPTCRAVYLSVEAPDSEDMVYFCVRLRHQPRETTSLEKKRVLIAAARQIRAMHDAGVDHADLHLKNLLVHRDTDRGVGVSIIDFDKARERDPAELEFRLRNLMRLARSARKLHVARDALTVRDRIRFLREYLRGRPDADGLLRAWLPLLARSGRRRETWWSLSGADRDLRGDRLGAPD